MGGRNTRNAGRRRLDAVVVAATSVAVGGLAAVGSYFGRTEQVLAMSAVAELRDDGAAHVTEVIDYDFGARFGRHGLVRDVPDDVRRATIRTDSPDAPDARRLISTPDGTRIRIGDPDTTVTGRHRYRIDYSLLGVADDDGIVAWDAVGTEWDVGMAAVEVHLLAPFELLEVVCSQGSVGSRAQCDDVREVAPGHVLATVDHLDDHEGVTVTARRGAALDGAPALPAEAARPDVADVGLLPPALAAVAGGLVGGAVSLWLVRRAGRERLLVGAGGPADAAFGAPAGPAGQEGQEDQAGLIETRIDEADLADMATTDFAPPEGMTASQGGIVLAEEIRPEHRVAWLLEAAIEGAIELVPEGGSLTMVRRAPGSAWTAAVLDQIFSGRERVRLGSYDMSFAIGWGRLALLLYGWRSSSGLWDERAGQRSSQGRIDDLLTSAIALVFGVLGAVGGGVLVHRWLPLGLLLAAAGGAALSAGVARFTARWELRVRTPAGSAAWLRVESFRRFLAGSEAYHAEEAAKRGVLREYTAWAVAVGEIDRWSEAVRASTTIPAEAGAGYAWLAPVLWDSAERTRTEPATRSWSGSGGSGGFGGSSGRNGGHRGGGRVGSGSGGGGGGSW